MSEVTKKELRRNMSNSIGSLLLVQVILIALNAVFASAELAILSINETNSNILGITILFPFLTI